MGRFCGLDNARLTWQPERVAGVGQGQPHDAHKTMIMRVPERTVAAAVQRHHHNALLRLKPDPTQAELKPDMPVRMQVVITNEGSEADRFVVGCIGLPNSWVRMPSRPILLDAGQSKTIPVLVQPAQISHTKPGTYKLPFLCACCIRSDACEIGRMPDHSRHLRRYFSYVQTKKDSRRARKCRLCYTTTGIRPPFTS